MRGQAGMGVVWIIRLRAVLPDVGMLESFRNKLFAKLAFVP